MKQVLLLLCFISFNFISICQECIDTVKIRCWYRQYGTMDVSSPDKKTKDLMLLDIGSVISRYYSHAVYLGDSIIAKLLAGNTPSKQMQEILIQTAGQRKRSGTHDYEILKNCPINTLSLMDKLGPDFYRYEEKIPNFDWELTDDTLTVCGYLCKRARTAFRGRNYEAWYASEIPISLGPWKFAGLPGLILKIQDDKKDFLFECTYIEKLPSLLPFKKSIHYRRAIVLNKSEYNKNKQKYMDNRGTFVTGNPVVQRSEPLPSHNYVRKPFNPIELTEE